MRSKRGQCADSSSEKLEEDLGPRAGTFFMGDSGALLFAHGDDPGDDTAERQDRHENMHWFEIQRSVGGGPIQEEMTPFIVTEGPSSWYRHERHRKLLGVKVGVCVVIIGEAQSDEVMEREEQKERGKGKWRIYEEMGA